MSSHLTGAADVTQCGPAGLARCGVPWDDSCGREILTFSSDLLQPNRL